MNDDRNQKFLASSDELLGIKEVGCSSEHMEDFILFAEKLGFSPPELSELRAAYATKCGERLK